MIIKVKPPGTIQSAVNSANPGDVILVADGLYHEQVSIPASKDFIRIIAKSHKAILDGRNTLAAAFTLTDTTGVEINGFTIKNYTAFGINVTGGNVTGGFNRIVDNRIRNIQNPANLLDGTGVQFLTDGNLAMGNNGRRLGETLLVFVLNSRSNRAIQNMSQNMHDDGMDVSGQNHAVIGNRYSKANCEVIFASGSQNSLLLDNELFDSGDAVFLSAPNNVVIHNHIFHLFGPGISLTGNSNNTFIADNLVEQNAQASVEVNSDFNIIQNNLIQENEFDGIKISTTGNDNLILRNRLEKNILQNIVDNGTDNHFIQNKES